MNRRFFLAGAASLVALPAAAGQVLVVNSPGDGYLNLRTGPGSRFAIIRRMPHGSRVEVLESAGNWLRVRHQSGSIGWAYARYLVAVRPTPPGVLYVADPRDGWLNLRSGPGTRFRIIGRMDNGTWVQVLERSGRWVRVRHQSGAVGWAYRAYLRR